MQDAKIRAALLVICLACLLGSGYVLLKGRHPGLPPVVFTSPPSQAKAARSPAAAPLGMPRHPARIYVDVAGAVRRPSLYILPPGSRVMQAVQAAGGPTAAADMDAVNLAQPVTDGEKVFIPKLGAVSVAPTPSLLPAAPLAAKPTPAPEAVSVAAVKTSKGSGSSRSGKITAESGEQIGLNSATTEQLERLPGVGPSMAARILAYRQQSGGFSKIEDLTLVTGIGPKKFAKIAPFVTVN